MSKLQKTNLAECLKLIIDYRGKTPKKLGGNWSKSGYRALSAKNIKTNGLKNFDHIKYGDESLYSKWMKEEVQRGDILLTSEAPAGEVMHWNSDEKIILSQRVFALRTKDEWDSEFIKYYLQSPLGQNEILCKQSGSTATGISAKMFKYIGVYYPAFKDQQKIASVLSALDAKIELNNRINTELEKMAKTLYDYWFVQFDFPDENGKPYKSSGGEMIWSEELKKEIPEGWGVKNLGDIAEIKRGQLITEKTANLNGKVKIVSAGINYSYFHDTSNREKNTITVSSSGANAGFINFWRESIFACDCITVRGENDILTLLILEFLKMRQKYLFSQARGSAQPHVYPKDLENLKIALPRKDSLQNLLDEFGNKVLPTNEFIGNNTKENQKLAELRDWLLPMLMNGQVTIK